MTNQATLPLIDIIWATSAGRQAHASGKIGDRRWSAFRTSGTREWIVVRRMREDPEFTPAEQAAIIRACRAGWRKVAKEWEPINSRERLLQSEGG